MRKITLLIVFAFSYLTSIGQSPCSPISSVDCDEIVTSLPIQLNFNGTEGGILNTGFTMVDPPSSPLTADEAINDDNVPGLISANLDFSGGALNVTATNGINFSQLSGSPQSTFTNSQMNALGVGFVTSTNVIDITATIAQPNFAGTTPDNGSQQTGIWFGLNENNFAKLVLVKSNATQQKIQLAIEQGDGTGNTTNLSIAELNTSNFNTSGVTSISFRISVDPSDNSVTGYYSLDGAAEIQVTGATDFLTAPAKFLAGVDHDANGATDELTYAGIMTSTRRATGGSMVIAYDSFGIAESVVPTLGFEAHVNFQDASTEAPAGYLVDYGLAFPASTLEGSYGWKLLSNGTPIDVSGDGGVGRNRLGGGYAAASNQEKLEGTLVHFQGDNIAGWGDTQPRKNELFWELEIPNGIYEVTLGLGDKGSGNVDSRHTATLEGYTIIPAFRPNSTETKVATMIVQVADGALTVNGLGGFNSKITHIDVVESTGTPVNGILAFIPNTASETLVTGVTGNFVSTLSGDGATAIALNIEDDPVNTTADNFNDWLSLPATNVPGEFNFGIDASTLAAADTRNNRIIATAAGYTPAILDADLTVIEAPIVPIATSFRMNVAGAEYTKDADLYQAEDVSYLVETQPTTVSNTSYTPYTVPGGHEDLYYPRRYGPEFSYNFPIANGTYTVAIHMVENFQTAANARIFDVSFEGDVLIDDLDLFATYGKGGLAILSFDVEVTDEELNIDFLASINNGIVQAIEILQVTQSDQTDILSFVLAEQTGDAIIDATNHEISIEVANGTLLTTLSPTINLSDGATVDPVSGTNADLDDGLATYTVTAEDETTEQEWTVTITEEVIAAQPPVVLAQTFEISELAAIGDIVGTVVATDADTDVADLTYAITAGNGDFTINPNSGEITTVNLLDYAVTPQYTLTVEVSDGIDATSADMTIDLTDVCNPLSILPCEEVVVTLPVSLDFSTAVPNTIFDTNTSGTGFTAVLENSEARRAGDIAISDARLNGYEPSLLTLGGGTLAILSQGGIAYLDPPASNNNNNQINTLGVGLDNLSETITIKTTLLGITTGANSAQAGIWYGFDEDNFVKLNVNNNNVELRVERAGISANNTTDQLQDSNVGASGEDVVLEMVIDPTALTVEAFYTVGTGTRTSLGTLSLPANYFTGRDINAAGNQDNVSFAGIFATHRAGSQFTATFDDFSVEAASTVAQPPVVLAQTFEISELAAIGDIVGTVVATDADTDVADLTYAITAGNGDFTINPNSGEITTVNLLDYAVKPQYTLTIEVSDGIDATSADMTINVEEDIVVPPIVDFAFIEDFDAFSPSTGDLVTLSNGDWLKQSGDEGLAGIPVLEEGLTPNTTHSLEINSASAIAVHDFQKLIDAPVSLEANVPFYYGTYFKVTQLGASDGNRIRVAIRVDDDGGVAGAGWVRQIIGNYGGFVARLGLAGSGSNMGQTSIAPDQLLQFVVKGVWDGASTISYQYTITPTLAEGDNTWIDASASQTASGTPKLARIFISSTSTANNGKIGPIRLSTDYTQVVTEEINETELFCSPLSTLDCDQIEQSIPLAFDFSSDNGNISKSGFTMVLEPSARLAGDDAIADVNVPGYAASLISQGIDGLTLTSTKGLFYSQLSSQGTPNSANTNSQMNALGVGIDVPGAIFNISTSLLIPDFSVSAGNSAQQSGLWYGLDEDHIIKLVVFKTGDASRKIQLQVENMDNTTAATAYLEINTANIPSNPGDELSLRLELDPLSNTVSAYYAINGATEVLVSDGGGSSLAVPANYFSGTSYNLADSNALLGFTGVFASHRNAAEDQSFNTIFKQFEITAEPELPQLSFDVSSLNFNGAVGSLIASKTVVLSANTGNPVVILSPDPDASWLVLPSSPNLGSLEIGIAANLPIGSYSTTLYAIDQPDAGYINGELFISLEITEESNDFAVNINFSDAATVPPTGYIRDFGLGYGDKGNGLIYGWMNTDGTVELDLTRNGRIRNYTVNDDDDLRVFTLMHMQYGDVGGANGESEEGIWEIEVPNGQYNVTVGVGDPDVDSPGTTPSHTINVEGTSLVSNYVPTGVAGASTRFTSGFATVLVSDGKLTVDAAGGFNTKINSIRIVSTTGGSQIPRVVSSTPTNGSINVSTGVNISANNLFLPNFDGIGNSGVDNATITVTTVKLIKNGSSTPLAAGVNGTGGGDAINLDPNLPLEPNTIYTFIIDGVLDNTGVAFDYYESTFTTGSSGGGGPTTDLDNVSFTNSGAVANGAQYSTLTIGPDNKLYGLVISGDIHRWTIETDGTLSNKETLNNWKSPSQGNYANRTSVGLVFDPSATASNLIAYLTHDSGGLNGAPAWDGNLSRLTGPNLENHDLILTQLPRSKKDHLTNSMAFKPGEPRVIYFNQGSNSAAGAPDNAWGNRRERLLSAANLRLDLDKLPEENWPLNAKTTMDPAAINAVNLNSPTLTSTVGTYIEDGQTFTDDGTYNPFYVNAPLTLFATGIRNAYDLVWHSNGQLYIPTNGTAGGSNAPASINGTRRPDGTFYDHSNPLFPVIPASNSNNVQKDWLFRIDPNTDLGFYGHPNPLLGQFVLNRGDADVNNGVYNGVQADINYRGAAFDFELNKSPNGVIEYKSNAENGNLKGAILVVRYSGGSDIIALVPDGPNGDILTAKTGIPGFSGFSDPLDLVEDVTNGNIYVSDFARNEIVLLKPSNQAIPTPLIVLNTEEIIGDAISNSSNYNEEIIISNLGNAVLSGVTAQITGANSNQFSFTGLPSSVNTQSSESFNVIFTPTSNGPKYAELTISGTGADAVVIALTGLGKAGNGGANEPSLQWVLDTQLGNGVINVGDTNPATNVLDLPNGTTYNNLLGDEISAQKFERATDAPVTLELLSVYGPTTSNPVVAFGYYESGNAVNTNELFTISNSPTSNGQTLNAPVIGSTEFDPGLGTFGFYSRWPAFNNRQLYSEDVLNTFTGAIPHHVRVYELPGESNAYIIATEEHISGFDYQDVVVIARNIRPFGGLPKIAADSNELVFEITTNGQSPTTETKSVVVSNTGTEVLNISSIAIEGAFADQFNEVQPSGVASIEVGESLIYTVTYAPDINGNNLGYQDASLVVQSDDSTNPSFSIGLFGLKKSGFEGGNEPPLQDVVNALGIGINVGWTTLSNGTNPNPIGDEVEVERWVKASDAPVNIIPVGRYSPAETIPFGWYSNDGNIVTHEVGILDGTLPEAQTLYPAIDTGTNVFDPLGAVFGIYVQSNVFNRTNYTEDALNTEVAHRTRIYPNKDRLGAIIENSYLVAFEDASNGDYQDYMFVIDNVIPYEDGILALNFDKDNLDFVASINQVDIQAKQLSISRNGGVSSQEITLSSSEEWVILPNSFDINSPFDIDVDISNLSRGIYEATVTATATNYEETSVIINLNITNELVYTYQFNFQDPDDLEVSPIGYIDDIGLSYSIQNTSLGDLTYGWVLPGTSTPADAGANARNRNIGANDDVLVKTFTIIGHNSPASFPTRDWLLNIPNGTYSVNIMVAGDPDYTDSNHVIDVNGITVVDYNEGVIAQVDYQPFESTALVEVTDGILRLGLNPIGDNAKVSYIRLAPVDTSILPPTIVASFEGNSSAPNTYRESVEVSLSAIDESGSGGIASLEYSLDGNTVVNYTTPIIVVGEGVHTLLVTAVDNNANSSDKTYEFKIDPATGALLVIENMTKIPGTDKAFPYENYFTFHNVGDRDSRPTAGIYDSNVLRVKNEGANVLLIDDINLPTANNFDYEIYDTSQQLISLPVSIQPNSYVDLQLKFIRLSGSRGNYIEELQFLSNADNALDSKATLSGAYQIAYEGNSEITAQEVINAFGFQTSMLSIVNDQGTIVPPNSNPNRPSSNFPIAENIDLGYEGDLIYADAYVQADASKPVIGIQLSAFHGPGQADTEFLQADGNNRVADINFAHAGNWYQTLLPRSSADLDVVNYDTANVISEPFRIVVGNNYPSDGGNNINNNRPDLLGTRVYKVIDRNGNVLPNEYIVIQDYIGDGCGAGSANCDWNDNVLYFSNIRPESVPSANPIEDYIVNVNDSFSLNIAEYFNRGYSGNKLTYTATTVGGNLPLWINFNNLTGELSGIVPQGESGELIVSFDAVDLNGLVANTSLRITINEPPVAVDDNVTTEQNVAINLTELLTNDSEPNGETFNLISVEVPLHGSAILDEENNSIFYTPTLDYIGDDRFDYTVQDASGLSSSATVFVTVTEVNQAPSASIIATPTSGDVALFVEFIGSNSTDDNNDIVKYEWNFGDGTSNSLEANTNHTFTSGGNYSVILTVTDGFGLSHSAQVEIIVTGTVNESPNAIASSNITGGIIPLSVSFTGSNSTDDIDVISYLWDFGDGTPTSVEANPEHIFTSPGLFEVTLTVYDVFGAQDVATLNIDVKEETAVCQLPNSWLNEDIGAVGIVGEVCYEQGVFEVKGSGSDIWNANDQFHYVYQPFTGDGEIITRVVSQSNTNAWAKSGIMMRSDLSSDSPMAMMAMSPNPNGLGVSYTMQHRAVKGQTMNVPSNILGPVSAGYAYYLRLVRQGDVFMGYASTTNGSWTLLGTRTIPMNQTIYVGLSVTSHSNSILSTAIFDNVSIQSEFVNQPPIAVAGLDITVTDNDNNGFEALILDGSGSEDVDGDILLYEWSEEGNIIATGVNPTVNFTLGNHDIELKVTDNEGATDTDIMVITVNAPETNQSPVANAGNDVSVEDSDVDGLESVTLNGISSTDDGTITSYTWRENGNVIATGISPTVSFVTGVHNVTLTVVDDGGKTGIDTVRVTVTSPGTVTCTDDLVNDDPAIVLPSGTVVGGVDVVTGTTTDTNGSPCALVVTNNDAGQPWGRYRISIRLSDYGISVGDELLIGVDGKSLTGTARVEINRNNAPNSALGSRSFGNSWSRYETTITVPSGISTLDLWFFSNYAQQTAGSAVFDNLVVRNLSVTGGNLSPVANAGNDVSVEDSDVDGLESVTLNGISSTDDGTITSYTWRENGNVIATGISPTVSFVTGVHNVTLTVVDDGGKTGIDTVRVTVTSPGTVTCTDDLVNDDPAIVLPSGTVVGGVDVVTGTTTDTNGSPCALVVTNNDAGQPWGRYRISIRLSDYGISVGDELLIGVDGKSLTGTARVEINRNNAPNSALGSRSFGNSWSRYETTITVPSGISTLDLWFFSNYGQQTSGSAVYDNLVVRNLSVVGTAKSIQVAKPVNDLTLYPNPANIETTLSFDQPTTVGTILVFDVTGRLVRTIKGGLIDERGTSVNVQELPTGTYFVKTIDTSGVEFQQQMLIRRQ